MDRMQLRIGHALGYIVCDIRLCWQNAGGKEDYGGTNVRISVLDKNDTIAVAHTACHYLVGGACMADDQAA